MSEEKELQDELIEKAKEEGAHASNIESGLTSAGFPDVDMCLLGEITQIELKHYRKTKLPYCNAPGIRPSQVRWMRKRVEAGGHPIFLSKLKVNNTIVFAVHHGRYAEDLSKCGSSAEMLAVPCVRWDNEMDWPEFFEMMFNKEQLP